MTRFGHAIGLVAYMNVVLLYFAIILIYIVFSVVYEERSRRHLPSFQCSSSLLSELSQLESSYLAEIG